MYKSHHSCFVLVVFSDVDKYRSASFFEEKNGQKNIDSNLFLKHIQCGFT